MDHQTLVVDELLLYLVKIRSPVIHNRSLVMDIERSLAIHSVHIH